MMQPYKDNNRNTYTELSLDKIKEFESKYNIKHNNLLNLLIKSTSKIKFFKSYLNIHIRIKLIFYVDW